MIRISFDGKEKEGDLLRREWLDTNGLGGYGSSTVVNCHTRKYHGLLVANLAEPRGRFVLLSKMEDTVTLGGRTRLLSLHRYPGTDLPLEAFGLSEVVLDGYPSFRHRYDEGGVRKDILLPEGTNTLLMRYACEPGGEGGTFHLRPFVAFREIHGLMRENSYVRGGARLLENGFSVAPYDGMPALHFRLDRSCSFRPEPLWYRNFEYDEERERGYPFREDLFTPGVLAFFLDPGEEAVLSVSAGREENSPAALWKHETARRKGEFRERRGRSGKKGAVSADWRRAAGQFLIRDSEGGPAVVAGYPWFYLWGRDTLISLPGLTFCLGNVGLGKEILIHLGKRRRNGLVPNCLSEKGTAAYNTADATLWYFWCVQEYLKKTGDLETVGETFWSVLVDLAEAHLDGRTGVVRFLEPSGLLSAGNPMTQLTWMDAVTGGKPVTPRNGCPVEINALWFNALSFLEYLGKALGRSPGFECAPILSRIAESFRTLFWMPERGYLADVVDPEWGNRDASLRPNQVFALSLPFPAFADREKGRRAMERVTEDLLTPYGLRTLSPYDPAYRPVCRGGPEERDGAYHQGTVWPWLIGHYGEALLRVSGDPSADRKRLSAILGNLTAHFGDAGLGTLSEIFDGSSPFHPRGCIAQAWSVAEAIRLAVLLGGEPAVRMNDSGGRK
jgi:predicted glycogen debranching enzyme